VSAPGGSGPVRARGGSDPLHPVHDPVPVEPAPVAVLAQWPAGTFLENLARAATGSWWVTRPLDGLVDEVTPDGAVRTRARLDGRPTGIVADGADLLVAVQTGGGAELLRLPGRGGPAELVCRLPGVASPNGLCRRGGLLVLADSERGALAEIDVRAGTGRVVRTDPALAPADPGGPLPGVNGLASTASGELLLTNTSRSRVLRLRGEPAGGVFETVAERLVADDLTAAADGTVYLATHTYHSILRLSPDGRRADIATHAQGVAGPTAVELDAGGTALVACTTGGLLSPPGPEPEPALLVRVTLPR
jgi:hypothetical protein